MYDGDFVVEVHNQCGQFNVKNCSGNHGSELRVPAGRLWNRKNSWNLEVKTWKSFQFEKSPSGFVWKCRVPRKTQWFMTRFPYSMAISLGIYPIFRHTQVCWYLLSLESKSFIPGESPLAERIRSLRCWFQFEEHLPGPTGPTGNRFQRWQISAIHPSSFIWNCKVSNGQVKRTNFAILSHGNWADIGQKAAPTTIFRVSSRMWRWKRWTTMKRQMKTKCCTSHGRNQQPHHRIPDLTRCYMPRWGWLPSGKLT